MNHASGIPHPLLDVHSAAAAQSTGTKPITSDRISAKAREVAESFESVFLFEVLQSMYADVKPGAFGGGQEETMFRSMMNEEIAKSISRQGGVGIADSVYREIMRQQEV